MLVGLAGVALINVMLPLAILRLATRRRVWGVRLLMALPVVVAIPMAVFLAIDAMEPVPHDPPWIGGTVVTLAGVPVVVYLSTLEGASSVAAGGRLRGWSSSRSWRRSRWGPSASGRT